MGKIGGAARTEDRAAAVGKDRVVASQRRGQAPGVPHLRRVQVAASPRVDTARGAVLRPCCIDPVGGGANEFHHF